MTTVLYARKITAHLQQNQLLMHLVNVWLELINVSWPLLKIYKNTVMHRFKMHSLLVVVQQ